MTNIFTMLFRRSEKRHAYGTLLRLDDHLLRDIGLERSDLHRMMTGRTAHTRSHRSHE
jgi:uncharacterized protein YjiS (DUF1127 family)